METERLMTLPSIWLLWEKTLVMPLKDDVFHEAQYIWSLIKKRNKQWPLNICLYDLLCLHKRCWLCMWLAEIQWKGGQSHYANNVLVFLQLVMLQQLPHPPAPHTRKMRTVLVFPEPPSSGTDTKINSVWKNTIDLHFTDVLYRSLKHKNKSQRNSNQHSNHWVFKG